MKRLSNPPQGKNQARTPSKRAYIGKNRFKHLTDASVTEKNAYSK
jgi:hypothetical protein